MKRLSVLTAIATLFISATSLLAAYPERPITLIVPWSAGGGTDAVGRIIAQGLQEQLEARWRRLDFDERIRVVFDVNRLHVEFRF